MKEIKLSQQGKYKKLNLVTLVDDEDYDWLNQWKWSITYTPTQRGKIFYARRNENGKNIKMHRQILGLTAYETLSDHIDGNGLNNQRSNLRIASRSQNNSNKQPYMNRTSKHLGVYKRGKKWSAHIQLNKKQYYLGCFNNEIDAALAYNKKAIELFGEFASRTLNKTG